MSTRVKRGMLKVVKEIAGIRVKEANNGWPPGCAGATYQPVRPIKQSN